MAPAGQLHASIDFTVPGHPRHALWQQCAEGVRALDSAAGKPWDTHSACMASSLTALAVCSGLERVDHVMLSGQGSASAPGKNVFVVQGAMNDPAHLRAHMPTLAAINQMPEQSFQQALASERQQAEQQSLQRGQAEQLQQARSGQAMYRRGRQPSHFGSRPSIRPSREGASHLGFGVRAGSRAAARARGVRGTCRLSGTYPRPAPVVGAGRCDGATAGQRAASCAGARRRSGEAHASDGASAGPLSGAAAR